MAKPCLGFIHARTWLKDVREHADPHLTCILVGNKVDLCSDAEGADAEQGANASQESSSTPSRLRRRREVTTDEAELWAKEEGLLFVEASAKSGVNVEFAFEEATRDILRKVHGGVFDDERVSHPPPLIIVSLCYAAVLIQYLYMTLRPHDSHQA